MRSIVRWLVALCILLMAAACEPAALPDPTTTPVPSATATATPAPIREPPAEATPFFGRAVQPGRTTSILRVIHVAPNAPALDILLSDVEFVGSLGYGLATGLTAVLPGTYTLAAQPRGQDTVLAETSVTLTEGDTIEIAVAPDADSIQFIAVEGPADALQPGMSVARVVNALPEGEALKVTLNGSVIPDSLPTGSITDLYTFPEGDLSAVLESAGTEILSETRRLRELTNMLLVVAGSLERPQLLVFESPVAGRYSLRVVNVSADAGEIDVYFDGALVASSLGYQAITDRTVYATGAARVSVHAADADLSGSTPLLKNYSVNPRPGATATLAIYGTSDDLRAMWIEDDLSPVPAGQSRVIFAHVLPGVNALRVGVNSTILEELRSFNYGSVSDPVFFSDGDVRLFFSNAADADDVVELRQAVPVPAGSTVLYFVTGAADNEETPPAVYTDPVAVNDTLSAESAEPPRDEYRVRYINAIASQPVIDVLQDGETVGTSLSYGEGTVLIPRAADSVQVLARMSGSDETVVEQHIGLPRPGDYSIFIFGTPENGILTALIDDNALPSQLALGQAATVRLINLTRDVTGFGLALSPVQAQTGDQPLPTLAPPPTSPGAPAIDPERRLRLPMGIPVPIAGVTGGTASRQAVAQANEDTYVVTSNNEIVVPLGSVAYEPATHTDIVVYEYRTATTTEAVAFALVYPPR